MLRQEFEKQEHFWRSGGKDLNTKHFTEFLQEK